MEDIIAEFKKFGVINAADVAKTNGNYPFKKLEVEQALKAISELEGSESTDYMYAVVNKNGWHPDRGATPADFEAMAAAYERVRLLIISAPAGVTTFKKMRKWIEQNLA